MDNDQKKAFLKVLEQAEKRHGQLLQCSPSSAKVSRLNPQLLAHIFAHSLNLKFCVKRQSYVKYNELTGVWEAMSHEAAIDLTWQETLTVLRRIEAPTEFETLVNTSLVNTTIKLLKPKIEFMEDYSESVKYFHAKNGMIVFDMKKGIWQRQNFSPEFNSFDQSEIPYGPKAKCPRFLNELVKSAMTHEDVEILQMYLGQCLLTVNLSQTFLLLIGTPGGGKSTLVNIIEKVIGKEHCAELRAAHTTGRFEIAGLCGKKLLTGKDVSSEFLNNAGGRALKFLTGNDTVTAEYKNSNKRVNVDGNFNIIITSNNTLRLKFDGDREAWRRRILLLNYKNPPPVKKIANFDDVLIKEEGSGILNWMMEGATKLIESEGAIPKNAYQKKAVDDLLKSSDPFEFFADNFIHPVNQASLTSAEVIEWLTKMCHKRGWDVPADRDIQVRLKKYMAENYGASQSKSIKRNGKCQRGYCNFQIGKKPIPNGLKRLD